MNSCTERERLFLAGRPLAAEGRAEGHNHGYALASPVHVAVPARPDLPGLTDSSQRAGHMQFDTLTAQTEFVHVAQVSSM